MRKRNSISPGTANAKRAYAQVRLARALDRFMVGETRRAKVQDARWVNAWSALCDKLNANPPPGDES